MEDHDYDEEEDEEEEPSTKVKIKIPLLNKLGKSKVYTGGGGGAAGAGGGGGRRADCPRKGDGVQVGGDEDIGAMPCHDASCSHCNPGDEDEQGDEEELQSSSNNSQEGKRKRGRKGKGRVGWREDADGGPKVTQRAGELLSRLLTVFGSKGCEALDAVLAGPTAQTSASSTSQHSPTDTKALVEKIKKQSTDLRIGELEHMLALVQLALNVDRYVPFFMGPP
jgi:hypothetical protein